MIVISMHPGWVRSKAGGDSAAQTTDEVVKQIILTNDQLTTKESGEFLKYDGTVLPF